MIPWSKSILWGGSGLLAAGVITAAGLWHSPTTHAVSHPPGLASTDLPTMLANSVGLPPTRGLTREMSGSTPLWANKDGTGPFTPRQLGLVGGLYQIWTSSVAVAQCGALGHGLQLPLPAAFVHAHPGQPLEGYIRVLQFNNATAPKTLLANQDYNFQLLLYKHVVTPIPQTIARGWAYAMPNQDHNGETDYVFQWAHGNYWNQVTVLGNISGPQALTVAQQITQ